MPDGDGSFSAGSGDRPRRPAEGSGRGGRARGQAAPGPADRRLGPAGDRRGRPRSGDFDRASGVQSGAGRLGSRADGDVAGTRRGGPASAGTGTVKETGGTWYQAPGGTVLHDAAMLDSARAQQLPWTVQRGKDDPKARKGRREGLPAAGVHREAAAACRRPGERAALRRSEEHTSELQSRQYLVCRLLLEKKISV